MILSNSTAIYFVLDVGVLSVSSKNNKCTIAQSCLYIVFSLKEEVRGDTHRVR